MDSAKIGHCRVGYFRVGMGKYAINQWTTLLKQFEGVATCEVTRRKLILTSQDSTTGWYEKTWVESTSDGILIPKSATNLTLPTGTYVRLDYLYLTADPFEEGDEIRDANNNYYEVKAVKPYYIGNSFFRRECDLTTLPLHEDL